MKQPWSTVLPSGTRQGVIINTSTSTDNNSEIRHYYYIKLIWNWACINKILIPDTYYCLEVTLHCDAYIYIYILYILIGN